MSDVKQCDRCKDVFKKVDWRCNKRVEAVLKEHTKGATAYNPTTYELCDHCTHMFVEWILDGREEQ